MLMIDIAFKKGKMRSEGGRGRQNVEERVAGCRKARRRASKSASFALCLCLKRVFSTIFLFEARLEHECVLFEARI